MTTLIDLAILKSLTALEAAQELVKLSSYELKGMCQLHSLRFRNSATKEELINLIIGTTHPAPAPAPAPAPEQLSF